MKILFDEGTPAPLRHELVVHEVSTLYEMGWSDLTNGDLLKAAEGLFDALVTDQNLRYQQNLAGRKLAILVLKTTSWPRVKASAGEILKAIAEIRSGGYWEVSIT